MSYPSQPPPPPCPPPPPPPPPPRHHHCLATSETSLEDTGSQEELHYLLQPILSSEGSIALTYLHNVTPQLQAGAPMCGLVALNMAATFLCRSFPQPTNTDRLLDVAIHHKFSKKGEILSARNMLSLAKLELPMSEGSLLASAELTPKALLCHLMADRALLVPYDCDKDHTPCLARGHKAHWCLVVGIAICLERNKFNQKLLSICDKDLFLENHYIMLPHAMTEEDTGLLPQICDTVEHKDVYVFARHGKSRHLGLWRLDKLLPSNANLTELDPQRSPDDYIIPSEGLSLALGSQIVLLQKK